MERVNITVNETIEVVNITVSHAVAGLSVYEDLVLSGIFTGTKQEFFIALKGASMSWDSLTYEQRIAMVRAIWDSLSYEEKLQLKGDPFRWQDFTEEMLAELEGPIGPEGPPNLTGTGARISGVDEGEYGEESYADGWIYKCVAPDAKTWIKWAVQEST